MYRLRLVRLEITIVLLALGLLVAACGPSANDAGAGNTGAAARLNKQGNEAFAEGPYDQALVSYREAQGKAPELAEPYYNGSNALYRQEAYPEAGEQIKQALNQVESKSLAQNSHYNLGNVSYQTEEWEAAVQAYKQALLLDPDDHEAKYNLELALQQLQQQQQQQQQQQEQDPQDEQEQDEGDGEQDDQQEQDQSQEGDPQDQQDQDPEDSEDQQEQNKQGGEGQPENEGDEQGDPQPQPGQRMTSEQARQLLAAIAQDAETLQERLGQIFRAPNRPSAQDW